MATAYPNSYPLHEKIHSPSKLAQQSFQLKLSCELLIQILLIFFIIHIWLKLHHP